MGKLASKIFTAPKKWKVSKIFVYRTFKQLVETGTVVDHLWQGRWMQHEDQEAGLNSSGPYSVKSCEKAVSDSSRAEHIQDVHVWCVNM